jgi:hypothetical protein
MSVTTIKVRIDNDLFFVVGGEFDEMLAAVKEIPGRRYELKIWTLPYSLSKVQEFLEPYGFKVVTSDELLNLEIDEISDYQELLKVNLPLLEAKIQELDKLRKGYAFRSKSNNAARYSRDSACLDHAKHTVDKPLETLTELEVKGLFRACEIMGLVLE